MTDPYELHPKDKAAMKSFKKRKWISVEDVKLLVEKELSTLEKEKIPTWGYNRKHVKTMFSNLVKNIEKFLEEDNDS